MKALPRSFLIKPFIAETTFNREKLISSNDTTATVASHSRAFCKQEKRFNFRVELFIEF